MSRWKTGHAGLTAATRRHLLKTGTYGAMHLIIAMGVAYALSGSWQVALGIGLIEPAVQTGAYMLHERLWSRAAARRPAAADVPPEGRAAAAA